MSNLKQQIKTKLQKLGWFVQLVPEVKIQFFPSGKALYRYLLKQKDEKKFSEYKRLADLIAAAENHSMYQSLLKAMYPDVSEPIEHAVFISKNGKSSRNRKIKIDEKTYFEKNYLKKNHELKTILWIDENLSDFLNDYFSIPKIIRQFKGEFSHLLYLEYLDLKPIPGKEAENHLIQTSLELYQLSKTEKARLETINWSPLLLDEEKLFYSENILAAKKNLKQRGFEVNQLWEKINCSPRILAHGDLHAENLYQNRYLIDLDNFGYYPMGLDAAFIYMFYFEHRTLTHSFKTWLHQHYKNSILPEDWEVFQRNSVFYCFLYFQMRKDKEEYPEFYSELIKELKVFF